MTRRCKAAFAATVNGVPKVMRPGTLVPDDDPVIKGREHLFEDVDAFMQRKTPRVEEATAEPGARRSLSLPRKQAAKKTASKKAAAKPPAPAGQQEGQGDGRTQEQDGTEGTAGA
ncbi:hypothetical protein [Streptomyces sp. bgisy034]|uniref:hypothetical protein n=1 Tax=Streptomyces sp. bgisy034 TaxID=3413774 RepID=UPI003EB8697F